MAEDKKTPRSFDLSKGESRSFDLDKRKTRSFDLKKDDDAASVPTTEVKPKVQSTGSESAAPISQSANQSTASHNAAPTFSSTSTTAVDNNEGGNKKKWIWIALIIIVLAILAFLFIPKSQPGETQDVPNPTENVEKDTTATSPADSTNQDTTAIAATPNSTMKASPEAIPTAESASQASVATSQQESATSTPESSANDAAPAVSASDIETQARQVIKGAYGNNPERRQKLGVDYKAIQKRVNELMRK